ncbi:N/A [soil metagenome]
MNALTRWDPFREMEEMQSRLSHILSRRSRDNGDKETLTVPEWAPVVDITEDDKEYLISAELPEIKKEEIKITVENGVLILSGERKRESEEKGKKFHRVERAYGTFVRTFALPDNANANQVNAQFKDGLLKIHVGKSEAARPKMIEVS